MPDNEVRGGIYRWLGESGSQGERIRTHGGKKEREKKKKKTATQWEKEEKNTSVITNFCTVLIQTTVIDYCVFCFTTSTHLQNIPENMKKKKQLTFFYLC